jgi:large subunit ribosomal protein L10
MARADKAAAVAEIADKFRDSSGAVLTEYRGLTVKQLKELRVALGSNAYYAVVKNTLTKIAAKDAGVESVSEMLAGPSAIAFITGDPVETAKGLRDFAKANPQLLIKGGVLDGKPLTPAEIDQLASLESREVLLAKLAGAMKASLSGAAALFAAPLSQTARVLGALQEKARQDPSVLAGGAGEPAAADTVASEASDAAEATAVPDVAEATTDAEATADSAGDSASESAAETVETPTEAATTEG